MPHRRGVGVLVFFVLVFAFLDVSAFDGERKGFVLGFGIGSGFLTASGDVKLDGSNGLRVIDRFIVPQLDESFSDTDVIFATDFKIGMGVSDRLLIYYSVRASWIKINAVNFSVERDTIPEGQLARVDSLILDPEPRTVANAVAGIGVSYYLKPAPPSIYITGSVGVSSWTSPFDGDDWLEPIETHARTWFGFGATAGVGYELTKRWALEATAIWSNPGKTGGSFDTNGDGVADLELGLDVGRNTFGVMITVNGIAY